MSADRLPDACLHPDYSFPLAEKVKVFLADPSAFAVAAPAAAALDVKSAALAAKVEAPKE